MIANLQKWADKEKDEYGKRHHLMLIESLARQIKDAKLFEKTRIASWGKLSTAALIDIARVYLESGDVETAHSGSRKSRKVKPTRHTSGINFLKRFTKAGRFRKTDGAFISEIQIVSFR